MAAEEQKAKILAAIEARGWFTAEVYQAAARQLREAGLIKLYRQSLLCWWQS